MPLNNPFVGGVHIASYSSQAPGAPDSGSAQAAVTPSPVIPGGGGPSYAVPMVTLLVIALAILIATQLLGIRLLTTVSARVGR
jgi:hypothetical protein